MQRYTVFFIVVNAQCIDRNKEYCVTLHIVGYT
jgi:hypothetical protein